MATKLHWQPGMALVSKIAGAGSGESGGSPTTVSGSLLGTTGSAGIDGLLAALLSVAGKAVASTGAKGSAATAAPDTQAAGAPGLAAGPQQALWAQVFDHFQQGVGAEEAASAAARSFGLLHTGQLNLAQPDAAQANLASGAEVAPSSGVQLPAGKAALGFGPAAGKSVAGASGGISAAVSSTVPVLSASEPMPFSASGTVRKASATPIHGREKSALAEAQRRPASTTKKDIGTAPGSLNPMALTAGKALPVAIVGVVVPMVAPVAQTNSESNAGTPGKGMGGVSGGSDVSGGSILGESVLGGSLSGEAAVLTSIRSSETTTGTPRPTGAAGGIVANGVVASGAKLASTGAAGVGEVTAGGGAGAFSAQATSIVRAGMEASGVVPTESHPTASASSHVSSAAVTTGQTAGQSASGSGSAQPLVTRQSGGNVVAGAQSVSGATEDAKNSVGPRAGAAIHPGAPSTEAVAAVHAAPGVSAGVTLGAAIAHPAAAGAAVPIAAPMTTALQAGATAQASTGAAMHPGQVFDALDGAGTAVGGASAMGSAPGALRPTMGSPSLSVGYQDARLGYVELQARQVAGSIQATLVSSSEATRSALEGQLGSLGGWLAQRATPVDRLTVTAPNSRMATDHGGSAPYGGGSGGQAGGNAGRDSRGYPGGEFLSSSGGFSGNPGSGEDHGAAGRASEQSSLRAVASSLAVQPVRSGWKMVQAEATVGSAMDPSAVAGTDAAVRSTGMTSGVAGSSRQGIGQRISVRA